MIIILTDLDGTLLDAETYSCEPATDALKAIAAFHIPLVMISSKTGGEIEYVRRNLNNNHPFVSENGGTSSFRRDTPPPPSLIPEGRRNT